MVGVQEVFGNFLHPVTSTSSTLSQERGALSASASPGTYTPVARDDSMSSEGGLGGSRGHLTRVSRSVGVRGRDCSAAEDDISGFRQH